MRIGLAITSLHGGGAEFVARTWAAALDRDGHEVFVYTYLPERDTQVLSSSITRRHFPLGRPGTKHLLLPIWLRRHAKADGLDILICLMTFTNLMGIVGLKLGKRSEVPLVLSERNMPSILLPRFGASGRFQLWLAQRTYRRADAVVAISHPVAGDLVGGFRIDPGRVYVVPNPVVQGESPKSTLDPPEKIVLGFVGRLVRQKRPELFVEVLGKLAERGVEVEGVMVGEGPMASEIQELARSSDLKIRLMGWVEPWTEVPERFDCLLLPSVVEGFGNVLVEAAEARIPCVASSLALGVADAIIPGITGELSVGDAPEELADAVLRAVVISEVRGIRGWLDRFSTECSAGILITVLEKVIGESHQGESRL